MTGKSPGGRPWMLAAMASVCVATALLLLLTDVIGQEAPSTTQTSQPETADQSDRPASDGVQHFLTVDVEMTDDGFNPSSLMLPVGERIQLLVRNNGSQEHHFHIMGLEPENMLWQEPGGSEPMTAANGDVDEDEHATHHQGDAGLVPFHTCTSGICPTGNAVHAHADPGEIDVVWFTAPARGTFEVVDPLDPGQTGSVTVY